MKITDELLRELGFVKNDPFWDYNHGDLKAFLRFYKSGVRGDSWQMTLRGKQGCMVNGLMEAIVLLVFIAHNDGLEEGQDKIHQALGLERLVEKVFYRLEEERSS